MRNNLHRGSAHTRSQSRSVDFRTRVRQRLGLDDPAPDEGPGTACADCRTAFTRILKRKVLCGCCRRSFCAKCCNRKRRVPAILVPEATSAPVRVCRMCAVRCDVALQCAEMLEEDLSSWPVMSACENCAEPTLGFVCKKCESQFRRLCSSFKADVVLARNKKQLMEKVKRWNGFTVPLQASTDATERHKIFEPKGAAEHKQMVKDIARDSFVVNGEVIKGSDGLFDSLFNAVNNNGPSYLRDDLHLAKATVERILCCFHRTETASIAYSLLEWTIGASPLVVILADAAGSSPQTIYVTKQAITVESTTRFRVFGADLKRCDSQMDPESLFWFTVDVSVKSELPLDGPEKAYIKLTMVGV